MKLSKWTIGILVVIGLLLGGLVGGVFLDRQTGRAAAAPSAQTSDQCAEDDDGAEAVEAEDTDNVENEQECGPQDENEADEANQADEADEINEGNDGNEGNKADESDASAPSGLGLTADQAQAIAEKANPNATTLNVEFDQEGSTAIWEVELDNGQDVKVDAQSGQIILTEARD